MESVSEETVEKWADYIEHERFTKYESETMTQWRERVWNRTVIKQVIDGEIL